MIGKVVDVWKGWRYRVQQGPEPDSRQITISRGTEVLAGITDPHHIVQWEPDYVTRPLRHEGRSLVIEWPDGFDYRGLCMEGAEVHAIYKPLKAAA
jgi:hypothetical protein